MGNFYTNIVLRDKDAAAVSATLGTMGRRAYVAASNAGTIVFDERCDTQDIEALERLARELSRRHGPALAVCNHDDDVLWYALAAGGHTLDRYNSLPSFFDEGTDEPAGGDAALLCESFGARERTPDVSALLRQMHADVGFEVDRHAELCRLVGLPMESIGMGYRYVSQGEFSNAGGVAPTPIGGAPALDAGSVPGRAAAPSLGPMAELAGTPAGEIAFAFYALLRSEVDVPTHLAGVLGAGRVNALLVLERLKRYIAVNRLLVVGQPIVIRGDAFVEDVLGLRELPFTTLTRAFCERFGVSPLTAAERAAFESPSQEFARRYTDAMMHVLEQLEMDVKHGGPSAES